MTAAQYFTNFIIDQTLAHTFSALLTRHGRCQRRYYCFKSRPECLGWSAFIFQTSCLRGEQREGGFKGWTAGSRDQQVGGGPLFHTRHRHNFSPSHTPEGLSIPRLMRTWYDENLWTNKQHCPVSALSGLVSLPWHTQSDDKMGRDNGKLTRPGGITLDLARSIAYMILSVKENWIAESETFSSLTSR